MHSSPGAGTSGQWAILPSHETCPRPHTGGKWGLALGPTYDPLLSAFLVDVPPSASTVSSIVWGEAGQAHSKQNTGSLQSLCNRTWWFGFCLTGTHALLGLLVAFRRAVWRARTDTHRGTHVCSLASLRASLACAFCLTSGRRGGLHLLQSSPAPSLSNQRSPPSRMGFTYEAQNGGSEENISMHFQGQKRKRRASIWSRLCCSQRDTGIRHPKVEISYTQLAANLMHLLACVCVCVCVCVSLWSSQGLVVILNIFLDGAKARCDFLRILFTVRCCLAPEQNLRDFLLLKLKVAHVPFLQGTARLLPRVPPPCKGCSSPLVSPESSGTAVQDSLLGIQTPLREDTA